MDHELDPDYPILEFDDPDNDGDYQRFLEALNHDDT